jgi:hypothetical protein
MTHCLLKSIPVSRKRGVKEPQHVATIVADVQHRSAATTAYSR